MIDLTVDLNITIMVFYDAVGGSKAQAGPPTDFFGGKKWFENSLPSGIVHADTGVGYWNSDIFSCIQRIVFVEIVFFQNKILGFKEELATGGHGLPGIHEQVKQYLLDLSAVDFNRPQILLKFLVNQNFLFGAAEHFRAFFQQLV